MQGGQATWSDRILKDIMEKQERGVEPPHNAHRMQKDVFEFPQFPEDLTKGHAAWNDWPWKLHRINGEKFELYQLDVDPMETKNLADDPTHKLRLERMQGELDRWMRSVIRSLNGEDYKER